MHQPNALVLLHFFCFLLNEEMIEKHMTLNGMTIAQRLRMSVQ